MTDKIKEIVIAALAQCDATKMKDLSSSVESTEGVVIPLEFAHQFAKLLATDFMGNIPSMKIKHKIKSDYNIKKG